jgi:hypothetical protein
MPNGINITCRIVDVSQSRTGIASASAANRGSGPLGKVRGSAARRLEDGFLACSTAISAKTALPATKFAKRFFTWQRGSGATHVIATAAKSRQREQSFKFYSNIFPSSYRSLKGE